MRVGRKDNDVSSVQVSMRQRYVMSLCLFSIFVDGVVKRLNLRIIGKGIASRIIGLECTTEVMTLLW